MVIARPRVGGDPEPFDVLFLHRPQHMRVFAGFHVFPGGTLHAEDAEPDLVARSALSQAEAADALGEAAGGEPPLAFFICAVREMFEETGLLLASAGSDALVDRSPGLDAARRKLIDDELTFTEVVSEHDLRLRTDLLRYLTRWVAPEVLPVRFDLRVFVAEAFGEPEPDPHEADAAEWMPPGRALGMAEAGAIVLAPPTIGTLNAVMRFTDARALVTGGSSVRPGAEVLVHSPLVSRIVAPNASMMTGPGTNTYIVGTGPRIVIDPGVMDKDHLEAIASLGDISTIVVTHSHPDHFPGALDLADMTGAEVSASVSLWEKIGFASGRGLVDGEVLHVGGATLQVLDTPGHASDHICLWMHEERALFSGDLVLGEGTTVISPPDGDLGRYLESLRKVRALEPEVLYPGHFPPRGDAADWIDHYIAHRAEREKQILDVLTRGPSGVAAIVKAVYVDVPEALHPVAERSVLAHLLKLESEGAVAESEGWYDLLPVDGDATRPTGD